MTLELWTLLAYMSGRHDGLLRAEQMIQAAHREDETPRKPVRQVHTHHAPMSTGTSAAVTLPKR